MDQTYSSLLINAIDRLTNAVKASDVERAKIVSQLEKIAGELTVLRSQGLPKQK